MKAVCLFIASNRVPYFQMRQVGSHSTSETEKKGQDGWGRKSHKNIKISQKLQFHTSYRFHFFEKFIISITNEPLIEKPGCVRTDPKVTNSDREEAMEHTRSCHMLQIGVLGENGNGITNETAKYIMFQWVPSSNFLINFNSALPFRKHVCYIDSQPFLRNFQNPFKSYNI